MSLVLFLMAFRYLLAVQFGFIGAVVIVPFAMFFLYGFVKYWRLKISKAFFFEDYFELYGRGLRETLRYEDIQSVEMMRRASYWLPLRLAIRLKREPNLLLLVANPRSESLNMDLHSWLVKKLAGQMQTELL